MFSLRHTGRARRPCELRHNGRSFSYVTPVDRCFRYVTLVDICFSNVTPVDRCFSNVTPVEHVDVLAKSHADAVLIGMNWNFHRINESLLGWAKRGHRLSVFVNIAVDKSVLKLPLLCRHCMPTLSRQSKSSMGFPHCGKVVAAVMRVYL